MTFWSLTDSDFPTNQTFHQFHDLIPNLTFTDYEWFQWTICNGCGMPAGNAYPSGHLVPIVGLACVPIVKTRFLELAMYLLHFSPLIPLGTFSILLGQFQNDCESMSYQNYVGVNTRYQSEGTRMRSWSHPIYICNFNFIILPYSFIDRLDLVGFLTVRKKGIVSKLVICVGVWREKEEIWLLAWQRLPHTRLTHSKKYKHNMDKPKTCPVT